MANRWCLYSRLYNRLLGICKFCQKLTEETNTKLKILKNKHSKVEEAEK